LIGGPGIGAVALTLVLACGAACSQSKGYRIVLPDGYVGWVRVDFQVPGAPPLAEEDGFGLLVVPESGEVATSSDMRTSPKRDEVFFDRRGGRARAQYHGRGITHSPRDPKAVITWWVFFGPEDSIRTEEAQRKVNGNWIPGRMKSVPPPK
jgi:hypothetical protein